MQSSQFNENFGPVGEDDYTLPYSRLKPSVFESFCQELIERSLIKKNTNYTVEVHSTGRLGQEQGGGDFIVTRHYRDNYYHELYEVKRREQFTPSLYREVINEFQERLNSWERKISTFYIMLSKPAGKRILVEYKHHQNRLDQFGINHQIIDSEAIDKLMKEVKDPVLLKKYFGELWVERFYGLSAVYQLKQGGIYHHSEMDYWKDFKKREENLSGNIFTLINEHVYFQSFLPKLGDNSFSCFINLRVRHYNQPLLTLSQTFMLKNAFVGTDTPIELGHRPWITPHYKDDDKYFCDLQNCRVFLSKEVVIAICDAFDSLWQQYKKSLQEIETIYQSTNFDSYYYNYNKEYVPLMRIPFWLWNRIITFCEYHNYLNSQNEWSIFVPQKNAIIILNNQNSKIFLGKQVTIRAVRSTNHYDIYNNDIFLLWKAPSNTFHTLSLNDLIEPNNYTDALTTHHWLMDTFLPYVHLWFEKYVFPSKHYLFFKRKIKPLNKNNISSFYNIQSKMTTNMTNDSNTLHNLLYKLQYFYSCNSNNYFSEEQICSLYHVLLLLIANSEVSSWRDICSYIRVSGDTYEQTKEAIEKTIQETLQTDTTFVNININIDFIFRAMIVCYQNKEPNLSQLNIKHIIKLLRPFIIKMEDRSYLYRYQEHI